MNYLFSDFYLLCGVADKETRTVGDAYQEMSRLLVAPVTASCLLHALRGLVAGGYITVSPEGGMITATTPVSLTDAGKKAAVVSGLQKLLGEVKAFNKNEMKFCGLERPDVTDTEFTLEPAGFAAITDDMMQKREIFYPLFELTDGGEGMLSLTVHHPGDSYSPDEDEDGEAEENSFNGFDPDSAEMAYSVSVTGSHERIMQGMSDLLSAAHALLTQPSRTRKVALHGADKSLIVTLAQAASEHGTVLRMTVEQIRFNRQRFYGKRDGDLDYAQCGDPIIVHEMNGAVNFAALLLPCAAALPDRLGEGDLSAIDAIHKVLKK